MSRLIDEMGLEEEPAENGVDARIRLQKRR
jgi:hypothetical protein